MKLEMTNEAGTGPDPDQWDGYPAERDAILQAFGDAGDVVVLSGDVHIGLAMDIPRDRHDERPVAVEFVTTSLTSQNVEDKMGWEPRTQSVPLERAWVEAVPYVKFADSTTTAT
jgi:alkaline phosphatase D